MNNKEKVTIMEMGYVRLPFAVFDKRIPFFTCGIQGGQPGRWSVAIP